MVPRGAYTWVTQRLMGKLHIPLITTNRINTPEKAEEIVKALRGEFRVFYEERDAIGKRYTRQDLIGTPFCIAVDYQTLEDNTVTIRHRDSMEQERVHIDELKAKIGYAVSEQRILELI
mgnify:CR=1 FL=1